MASSSRQTASSSEAATKGVAVEAGDINEVTRLLGKKADINYMHKWMDEGEEWAQTPLMAAVREGHAEVAKFLITRKANVNLAEPCHGRTALHYTSDRGSIPMIYSHELLMSKGAKHDVRDKFRCTPLHLAAVIGHKEAVICLLDHGADINAVNQDGVTALQMAACCSAETVKLLVLKGADMKGEGKGLTALDWAALRGQDKAVGFLIKSSARFNETGTVTRICKACGETNADLQLMHMFCTRCMVIHYCSVECQKSDWQNHKPRCLSTRAMRKKYMDEGIKDVIKEKFQKFKELLEATESKSRRAGSSCRS